MSSTTQIGYKIAPGVANVKVFNDLKIGLDEDLEEKLAWLMPNYGSHRILRKSVDARQRHFPHFVYSIEAYEKDEPPKVKEIKLIRSDYRGPRPIIIGAGPAGLFAALRFVERGVPCLLLERGSEAVTRMKSINRFWRYGELDPENNVCFGEGGAGLYSDGKLITRIKSPHISYVMNRLVKFGAPEEIEYLSNPHVGSDRIRRVIPKIREYLKSNGCEIHFDSPVKKFLIHKNGTKHFMSGVETQSGQVFQSDRIILATGHSATDIFDELKNCNVFMEGKSFALGLRIEHPQKMINQIQFRSAADNEKLGAANYRLTHHSHKEGIGVYSFCMCPGGYVLSSGTEADGVVSNGMSNYNRGSAFANAAIVVSVDHAKNFNNDVWGGMKLRRDLELKAYQMVRNAGGTKELPAQGLLDFLKGRKGSLLSSSSPSHAIATRLDQLLPQDIYQHLVLGIESFEKNMKGFISSEAQLYGVESRTSCPVRITRNDISLMSLSHSGLYPCGEGAGYAGGITSAACDGINVADKIMESALTQTTDNYAQV